jgi:hypothetical protein
MQWLGHVSVAAVGSEPPEDQVGHESPGHVLTRPDSDLVDTSLLHCD